MKTDNTKGSKRKAGTSKTIQKRQPENDVYEAKSDISELEAIHPPFKKFRRQLPESSSASLSNEDREHDAPLPTSQSLPHVDAILAGIMKLPYDRWGRGLLLACICSIVNENKSWNAVLDQAFLQQGHCDTVLAREPGLAHLFENCLQAGSCQKLFDSQLLRAVHSSLPAHAISILQPHIKISQTLIKNAFEKEYESPNPRVLLETMDKYFPLVNENLPYYNRSFPIIQSSGMGKSRLVDHSSTLRFTLPINLCQDLEGDLKVYPPPDRDVRIYLTESLNTDDTALQRHIAFLEALFEEVISDIEHYSKGTQEEIALRWYRQLKEGSTFEAVGTYRGALYRRVIEKAQTLEKRKHTSECDTSLIKAAQRLHQTLSTLYEERHSEEDGRYEIERDVDENNSVENPGIKPTKNETNNHFSAIIYFDEASTLHTKPIDSYSNLMRALNIISDVPIFFIFLSTNNSLQLLAPTKAHYPSSRVQKNMDLIPPFFRTPFNVFTKEFTTKSKDLDGLTLQKACKLEQMSKFGRPMWFSHYMSVPQDLPDIDQCSTISFAQQKLGGKNFEKSKEAQLAALGCRINLQYETFIENSHRMQETLVSSHMRCVWDIPKDRSYMCSAYLPEPMLSEAAARLLNAHPDGIIDFVPKIMMEALSSGLLARGERGEIVGQILLTIAHDLAINSLGHKIDHQPYFHQPIPLLSLLENLLVPDLWEIIQIAPPFHRYSDYSTLQEALSDLHVNFSHFVKLGDHASYNRATSTQQLTRGDAAETWNSFMQLQFKNRSRANRVEMKPTWAGDVGEDMLKKIIKEVPAHKTRGAQSSTDDIESRHYVITIYGCTSKTYRCIPKNSDVYRTLLRAHQPIASIGLHELNPYVYNSELGSNIDW